MERLRNYLRDMSVAQGLRWYCRTYDQSRNESSYSGSQPFYLASCGKSIFGFLVFQLLLHEKTLKEKFHHYQMKHNLLGDTLAIEDLLSHRTNLLDYLDRYDVNHGKLVEEIVAEFFSGKEIKISNRYTYSNTNYVVLYDFLATSFDVPELLETLNSSISERFVFLSDQSIISYDRSLVTREMIAKKNQVRGDGGIFLDPLQETNSNPAFMQKVASMFEQNRDTFENAASVVDEDTIYSFGVFRKTINATRFYFHSGFYHSNISYWVSRQDGVGCLMCVNHENIDKSEIDKIVF